MHHPSPRGAAPRRRLAWLAAAAMGLAGVVAPTVAPSPAGAANAPLVTEDGLGIRIDETALLGPALEAIETAMQPAVDDMIRDGAIDGAPVSGYHALYTQGNLELSLDFLTPGTGRPYGGVKVHADILDIELQYRRDAWWHSDCGIWVRPADATIDITANVDPTRLPSTPLALQPIQATWDDDPDVSTSGVCWTYLIDDWWNGFIEFFSGDDPESTASRIEAELNGVAQDLLDDVWADNVVPVLDSLQGFGITPASIRTDDHGLIVTADVDASAGITIPGMGGPFDVSGAQDSGADSDVNALLANRDEIIVTVHPNVANQFLYALNDFQNGIMGDSLVPGVAAEELFIPLANRGSYNDNGWFVRPTFTSAPYTQPTGPGGAPELQFDFTMQVRNTSSLFTPVATFTGTVSGVELITEVRAGQDTWGPGFDTSGATVTNLVRTQANAHASQIAAQSATEIAPYIATGFDGFAEDIFIQYLSLAPIELYGFSVDLCDTCSRFSGDERYTEVFRVN